MTITPITDTHQEDMTMSPKSTMMATAEPAEWAGEIAVRQQAARTAAKTAAEAAEAKEEARREAWRAALAAGWWGEFLAALREAADAWTRAGGRALRVLDESFEDSWRGVAVLTTDDTLKARVSVDNDEAALMVARAGRSFAETVYLRPDLGDAGAIAPTPAEAARLVLEPWLASLPAEGSGR